MLQLPPFCFFHSPTDHQKLSTSRAMRLDYRKVQAPGEMPGSILSPISNSPNHNELAIASAARISHKPVDPTS